MRDQEQHTCVPRHPTTMPSRYHLAEIVVKHPDLALTPTLEDISDLTIEIESQPATAGDSPVLFYLIETPSFQEFEESLESDHTVVNWQLETELNNLRIYQVRLSSEVKVLSPKMSDLGLRVLDVSNANGGWYLQLRVPDRGQLVQFQSYCDSEDVECQIHKLYSLGVQNNLTQETQIGIQLTDRQHEVAQTATEMGYFDPDGATANEIAAELDITPSTLSSHLRTVTAKAFKHLFT